MVDPNTSNAIRIDRYLTEAKLSAALQRIVPNGWLGDQVLVKGSRFRWDMSYQIDGVVTVVEYDGDEHYRHSLKIKADGAKDEIARKQGLRVVRFPYWVQLDSVTLKHYFGLEAQIEQAFPHGFISTRLFPASFCPASTTFPGQRQLFFPIDDNYSLSKAVPPFYTGADRGRG